ncbi:unnamed protein product [Cylindrotheca closterium]|uniref:Uncharacterized protein n=1 Tax=Cylindrotheca closterium TaxID=2856 RepID=A0AAD2FJ81_9STRA|nr:unnamed protein product [Cylindrotheca closterium]
MKLQEMIDSWQETSNQKQQQEIVEGTDYSVPIQIEYEEEAWQRQLMEHRSPADANDQERNSQEHPLAQDYPLEREPASTLTWESFMDTVAFPEKSIPGAVRAQDWTQSEARDALLDTCQDTVLCGALSSHQQEDWAAQNGHRAMMDDILDEEEF